jgi:hypothetical protein
VPFQVVDVDAAVLIRVVCQLENLAFDARLVDVEQWALGLEERGLVELVAFALHGVAGADEPLQAQSLEVLCEETGEVAPLRIITW